MSSDSSNHKRSDSDFVETTTDEDEVVTEFIFTYTLVIVYKNSCPGVGSIVGYEEDFCIGEIQNIVEEKGAAVKLMERC